MDPMGSGGAQVLRVYMDPMGSGGAQVLGVYMDPMGSGGAQVLGVYMDPMGSGGAQFGGDIVVVSHSARAAVDASQVRELEGLLEEARGLEAHLQERKDHLKLTLALIADKLQG
ncbi:hypothetical protein NHX12_009010 [Muraenolepis orangiensis]|uniref:Uncharacterized protein n=1 Tax=Muraenolepis orangiensis TaxID=630683 RepID=A0A9Q0DP73_9TELE|nr:hypothetical protein NHX12_009010 [Muraenolepis orangiensis]